MRFALKALINATLTRAAFIFTVLIFHGFFPYPQKLVAQKFLRVSNPQQLVSQKCFKIFSSKLITRECPASCIFCKKGTVDDDCVELKVKQQGNYTYQINDYRQQLSNNSLSVQLSLS